MPEYEYRVFARHQIPGQRGLSASQIVVETPHLLHAQEAAREWVGGDTVRTVEIQRRPIGEWESIETYRTVCVECDGMGKVERGRSPSMTWLEDCTACGGKGYILAK